MMVFIFFMNGEAYARKVDFTFSLPHIPIAESESVIFLPKKESEERASIVFPPDCVSKG